MCSHDEALLAAAASKVDLWHLPPPMLITEFPQLNIAQHPQSWSLNFTLPQSLNLFRPPTQAVAWWNSLWSIQIPKTCGQVERYDKVWQQVLCQWKCGNFRSCRVLVRFPDPPYDVTFKSVGEPDYLTPSFGHQWYDMWAQTISWSKPWASLILEHCTKQTFATVVRSSLRHDVLYELWMKHW